MERFDIGITKKCEYDYIQNEVLNFLFFANMCWMGQNINGQVNSDNIGDNSENLLVCSIFNNPLKNVNFTPLLVIVT